VSRFPKRRRNVARTLRLSIQLLAAHRLRTALSISGLSAGIAAVMVMVAVGEGAERRVVESVRAMGTDLIIVRAAPAPRIPGRPLQIPVLVALRTQDATAIAEESGLAAAVAPVVDRSLVARRDDRNTEARVTGTTADGLRIQNVITETGRPFDLDEDRERRRVALLGPRLARNLFGDEDPIGRDIRLGTVPFDVIGVLRERGNAIGGTDLDNVAVIPLQTAMRRLFNIPYVDALFVQARTSAELEALEAEVLDILLRRNPLRTGSPQPYVVLNQALLLRTERAANRAMNRLIVGVAALALLVGGIGILAVMLMSVRERTREIGLRRAVGARQSDIHLQFAVESALLATLGGSAGVIVGAITAAAAAVLGPWDLVFPWRAAALGLVCSTLLGLGVGIIPAARAARLEPVAALRAR
jgi:putative ABC transport system permease protein